MISRALDAVIGVVSPKAAIQRAVARQTLSQVRRGYDGAKKDRLNADWRPQNRAADMELDVDADVIRARARDLVRNNAHARGVMSAIVRNVVGPGIYPQARSTKSKYNDSIETLWERWQQTADVAGRLSFYEIERLALSEMIEAGECLIHIVRNDTNPVLPFNLELIEADRIVSDSVSSRFLEVTPGNEVRRGVEVDRFGKPAAYHIYDRAPSDLNTFRQVIRRLPAEDCRHIFKQDRIGQSRGISGFAPVVMWLRNLRQYTDNELRSQAVASCFSVFIKTMDAGAAEGLQPESSGGTADKNGNGFEYIEPALVARGFPGEEVQVINPQRGQAQAVPWINLMLRGIAVGTGISYERLARDYSQTNYSSNRAADLEDRREFRQMQDLVVRQLCVPIWRKFLAVAVVQNQKSPIPFLPSRLPTIEQFVANYADFNEVVWQAPGWEWVDPVKEVTADVMAIEKGLLTYADACAKRGQDWKEVFIQRQKEQEFAQEIGLVLSAQNVIPIAVAAIEADQQQQEQKANAQSESTALVPA